MKFIITEETACSFNTLFQRSEGQLSVVINEINMRTTAIIMAFVMTFSLFAIELQATEEESYTMITSLSDIVSGGRYLLAMDIFSYSGSDTRPPRTVAMKNYPPAGLDVNFDFTEYYYNVLEVPTVGHLWIIETFGDGYSIKVDGGGNNSYINIGEGALTLGERQELAINMSQIFFTINNPDNGYYISFAISYSCFRSSVIATLNIGFIIYRYGDDVVEPTQTPEQIATTSKAVRVNDTTVVLKVSTDADIPDDNLIHVALYDENDVLLDYILVPIMKEDGEEEFNKFYVVLKDNNNADYAKVFIWKDSMEPVSVADKVLISEIE